MATYKKCPMCGQIYNQQDIYYCLRCNCRLKKPEDVSNTEFVNSTNQEKHVIGYVGRQDPNSPKCPTCQSINIRKISGLERGASVFALGLFSKKIKKSFKCNNCGYTW